MRGQVHVGMMARGAQQERSWSSNVTGPAGVVVPYLTPFFTRGGGGGGLQGNAGQVRCGGACASGDVDEMDAS